MEAAQSGFMQCIVLPYLTEDALHDSYFMADLLFKNGIAEFTAEKAFEWITAIS